MNWNKVIFTIIIILLYVPLVFLGSNVFFPEYVDPYNYSECYSKPLPMDQQNQTEYNRCWEEQNTRAQDYQKEKRNYDAWKYLAIILFNLVVIVLTLFLKFNDDIMYGLFIGATFTTFLATIIHFQTRSKLGFAALVLVFIASIYF